MASKKSAEKVFAKAAKKPVIAGKATPVVQREGALQGTITVLAKDNPKRGASKVAFALYRTGQSTADYAQALNAAIASGALKRKLTPSECLRWDTKHGYIAVR